MSQYFDLGDETLWNPSNGAARLFLRQVTVFEAELDLPSGIGPMENDECQIDAATLEVFANALLAGYRRATHSVILTLSEGFVVTFLALAQRAGAQLQWPPEFGYQDDEGLREKVRDVEVRLTR